jgi:hypothetical protein
MQWPWISKEVAVTPAKKDVGTNKSTKGRLPEETREHLRAARKEMRQSIETLLPPKFLAHRRAARREMLLAAQSVIQHALDRLET